MKLPSKKPSSQNVLGFNFIDTMNGLAAEQRRRTITNHETRVKVNYYLQAVFQNDLTTAWQLLQKFKVKCNTNRNRTSYPRNVLLYVSCLSTLVAHLAQSVGGSVNDRRNLTYAREEVVNIPPHMVPEIPEDQLLRVKTQLAVAFVRHFGSSKRGDGVQAGARTATIELVSELGISLRGLSKIIEEEYVDLMQLPCMIWPNIYQTSKNPNVRIDITPNLSKESSMSLKQLCELIKTTRFQYKGDERPMYEIYDGLDDKEREHFIEEYYLHNRTRELAIERDSQTLQASPKLLHLLDRFSRVHGKWFRMWHTEICQKLASINSDSNPSLSKYSFFYTTYPADRIASLLLSKMLYFTLATGHVDTLVLAKSLARSFKLSLYHDSSLRPLLKEFDHFLGDDDSIKFFCGLIKLAIDCCSLPKTFRDPNNRSDCELARLFSSDYCKGTSGKPSFHKTGIVRVNEGVARVFEGLKDVIFSDNYLFPMLYPPIAWTTPTSGGFLEDLTTIIRTAEPKPFLEFLDRAHEAGQLSSLYDSLNCLGSLRWAINSDMLEVFNQAMKTEDGFLQIPPQLSKIKCQTVPKPDMNNFKTREEYLKAYTRYKLKKREAITSYDSRRQIRLQYDLVNTVANAYGANGDVIFFPYSADFRGRVYPSVSFMSHYGDDVVRSFLMFWDAKPLGPHGYNWIRYQLANLHSKTKLTMDDSILFVEKNMRQILNSAARPFADGDWWTKADHPWQTLALCKEIKRIEEFKGSPAEYRSRIPIHQDGTCNGLQHYAALGADEAAARSVNLLPSEERQDIYVKVLELVKKKTQSDIHSKHEKRRQLALECQSYLSRKLVKQTVMTTVYGVTYFGASEQIENRIREITDGNTPDNQIFSNAMIARYVAKIVLDSISELFSGAKSIQDWLLRNCLRCILAFHLEDLKKLGDIDFFSGRYYRPMIWSSLSGFPIVQLYKHDKKKEIVTPLQKVTVYQKNKLSHIDIRKQINALAPNFIHSLDAIHLQMTSIAARQAGISFAAVHDSFWTHACDVETLNKTIREEFIRLHLSLIIDCLRSDITYTTRNAWQLVWVDKDSDKKFIDEIDSLRTTYGIGSRRGKVFYNRCLTHEIREPSQVQNLVEKHRPKLWFQPKKHVRHLERYDEDLDERIAIAPKRQVPVLVPVRILKEPPTGALDINLVRDSVYFFS